MILEIRIFKLYPLSLKIENNFLNRIMEKKLLDYFNGDELAASTWLNKYAAEGETTPDDMHRRMAKEFAKIESKYELAQPVDGINPMGNKKLTEDDIYGLLKDFKYIIPGGSVMSVLGTNQNALISNCTVLPPPNDSMSSILNSARDMANLFKRRAGVGLDLSNLRPAGAHVNNSAKSSTGPVSFMDLYSTVVNTVSQKGRRGALMLSLSVSHPDVLEFIEKKQDLTKVTGANISVRVNDEFMKAVENNEDYILRYPVNQDLSYFSKDYLDVEYNKLVYLEDHKHDNKVFYIRKIRAKDLWDKLCECAWKTAEPGVLFWDNIMNSSPDGKYPGLKPVGTNPCGEQPLAAYDSCRLMHINLTSFVENPFTENATVNYNKLYEICYNAMRLSDDLVDIESNCLQRIALNDFREEGNDSDEGQLLMKFDNTAGYGRRTGLGFTGLADMVAMMNLKMTDAESENLINEVMSTMFQAELESSIDMAAIRERFPAYDEEYENKAWCDFVKEINPTLYDKMKMFGRRNISFSTCAPTGTVSLLARCSSGIEPVFMPYYTRRRKIQSDDEKVDFIDITGQKFTEFQVVHPGLLKFMEMKGYTDAKEAYEASPYYKSTAMDIPYNKRVAIQSTVQKYITSAISSTVNLPTETTVKEIDKLYHLSNELNLKGITVYRDGSREGILNKTPKPLELPKTGAPKRPKTLEADFYPIKVKGERFAVIVGLFDNRPYEVFTYKLDPSVNNVSEHRGVITKKKKMHYSFDSDYIHVDNLNADEVEERAATLYSSMLLRHGVDVKYIIKTAKKVNDNIISFSSAMCRVLSKYLESGDSGEKCPECGSNLIRTAGCLSCPNCGYSKCM